MFLKLVYKHNKLLLFLLIIFMIGQLFIGYKHGMVISPFYNYGMYSEVMHIKTDYPVFEIIQNGKRLRGQDFSPEQWDRIMLPLQYFSSINKSNELYEKEVKRLFLKINFTSDDKNFLANCSEVQFENWYKTYLSKITNQKTETLVVNYRTYVFEAGQLRPTNSFLPLAQLCR